MRSGIRPYKAEIKMIVALDAVHIFTIVLLFFIVFFWIGAADEVVPLAVVWADNLGTFSTSVAI